MNRFINRCVDLSELYIKRFLDKTIAACADNLSNPFNSLRFFLLGYAFERQGSLRDFAIVANEVISKVSSDFGTLDAKYIWNKYEQQLKDVNLKPNPSRNPLCPMGIEYHYKNSEGVTQKKSVIELLQENTGKENIVSFVKEEFYSDRVEDAYEALQQINGIGPKIAALFLRDVAVMLKFNCKKISNHRELLQPVDTWIRYCVRTLKNNTKLTDSKCAEFLKITDEPEKANQGMWYFCTQVAQSSRLKVNRSINNQEYMEQSIRQHKEVLISDGKIGKDCK
jgi:hypothetical protein